ncbi:hypothetical protein OEZ85_005322 [Tetradesmus obliquus]|uniref:Uncharacterized protein n=1 Tax=Tetradesmus obliquus TaxID=3088 RepID=A0ABY8UI70_TETOB|nr:hypothetical protein OEZ85_005322 [Tetradesmus obliquus]
MSGSSMGTIGVNSVSKESLNQNVPKWCHPNGQLPRTSQFLEVPFRFSGGMTLAFMGLGVLCIWANRRTFTSTPVSMSPEFQEAARKIGPVAERAHAPPVFLNPISNRIPGHYRGPEDVPTRP